MSVIKRIYPEAKTGLINWIEENFHDINSFVATFTLKNGKTITIYDCISVLEAFGIVGISTSTITDLAINGDFVPKDDKT